MPIELKISNDPEIELSIWKVTEESAYFSRKLEIHNEEMEIIEQLSNRKEIEWLASRYLLHIMSGRTVRGKFTKDVHGKPFLQNSESHISISHSNDHIAVIASNMVVGVDIQTFVSKISRIRHKFVSELEDQYVDESDPLRALHIIWGAKESLYKAYGKRGLRFIDHLHISDLESSGTQGKFKGKITKEELNQHFDLFYYIFDDYILVYAKESN